MKRNTMLKILNPILGILLVNQILTGFFHDIIPHEAFEILHERGGILFAIAVVFHVILNWGWIRTSFFKKTLIVKK